MTKDEKIKFLLKNLTCRRCGTKTLLSIIEDEYDYEVSCVNCGELWWIEKKRNIQLVGDDLKYVSSSNLKNKKEKNI